MADMVTKQDVWVKDREEEGEDSGHATEEEDVTDELDVTLDTSDLKPEDEKPSKQEIVWGNVVKFVILHLVALYGLTILPSISLPSWLFLFLTYLFSGSGITAGAHRLWAHRAYKVGHSCFMQKPPVLKPHLVIQKCENQSLILKKFSCSTIRLFGYFKKVKEFREACMQT